MNRFCKVFLCLITALLCLTAAGCKEKKPVIEEIPTTEGNSLIPAVTAPSIEAVEYTPVYATSFGDIIVLATVPLENWRGMEADCTSREISHGGRIRCNGEHEKETPTKQVLILEDLIPKNCSGWFRDMIDLENVAGAERLHTHNVTDMRYMFSGCEKMNTLDWSTWDVSKVEHMTGMFEDCYALAELPEWYETAE